MLYVVIIHHHSLYYFIIQSSRKRRPRHVPPRRLHVSHLRCLARPDPLVHLDRRIFGEQALAVIVRFPAAIVVGLALINFLFLLDILFLLLQGQAVIIIIADRLSFGFMAHQRQAKLFPDKRVRRRTRVNTHGLLILLVNPKKLP